MRELKTGTLEDGKDDNDDVWTNEGTVNEIAVD
jgi:hypothetical protein